MTKKWLYCAEERQVLLQHLEVVCGAPEDGFPSTMYWSTPTVTAVNKCTKASQNVQIIWNMFVTIWLSGNIAMYDPFPKMPSFFNVALREKFWKVVKYGWIRSHKCNWKGFAVGYWARHIWLHFIHTQRPYGQSVLDIWSVSYNWLYTHNCLIKFKVHRIPLPFINSQEYNAQGCKKVKRHLREGMVIAGNIFRHHHSTQGGSIPNTVLSHITCSLFLRI